MTKQLISLGLMSGTSGDGVDASIIQSDGKDKVLFLKDKYFLSILLSPLLKGALELTKLLGKL